ncbi:MULTISPECIES: hypothetical protein [unclassified Cyanobium]|uniref:hypothetical protein n=1 Tax=unclassified Cyanobium TaxID=2627006 RepID=UPI0020CC0F80|nr:MULTISPECIES: hypothetical protein [unclassified Cyanobium]MCP9861093.1 hypothetical protein [Cyanobium sp. Cruz-8H5]MCP9868327.1 hypothetical protein [Cyanobium sp. Cruz-8D1]
MPGPEDDAFADTYEGTRIDTFERGRKADAEFHASRAATNNKTFLSRAFVVCVISVTIFAGTTTWGHKDEKVREVAISLIGLPIGAIAGLLGGIGLH